MAAFHLIIYGHFWMITEGTAHMPLRSHSSCLYQPTCPQLKSNVRKKSYVILRAPRSALRYRDAAGIRGVDGRGVGGGAARPDLALFSGLNEDGLTLVKVDYEQIVFERVAAPYPCVLPGFTGPSVRQG